MKRISFLVILTFLTSFVGNNSSNNNYSFSIVPKPVSVSLKNGHFILNENTTLYFVPGNQELKRLADMFIVDIEKYKGIEIKVSPGKNSGRKIILELSSASNIPDEGYHLSIKPAKISIIGKTPQGIFYGFQSLKQLILTCENDSSSILIPTAEVDDYPRFSWRGMHLDVGRHFYEVDSIERFIDFLALYKLNRFHWHLTEDQGWRIEIKQYPRLTETGAWRKETIQGRHRSRPKVFDGTLHGGYYTQDQVREIVQYASDRFITVIPEIEMPGHAQAAIASYPELGVTGNSIDVLTEWGISPYIFKPSDETFIFLENVLSEILNLFPSEYIHIGGDEAIKDQWKESSEVQELIRKLDLRNEEELQSWFIKRIEQFLNSRGRQLIGWDEILQGGLAPNATVMSWHGVKKGIEAAEMGHDVVMCPNSHLYFSYYQADPALEPLASGNGLTTLEKVYLYEPVPKELSQENWHHILGLQGCVWTEYMKTFKHVEYMIFPRITALSEVAWSKPETKDYNDFTLRVQGQISLFNSLGINYCIKGVPE